MVFAYWNVLGKLVYNVLTEESCSRKYGISTYNYLNKLYNTTLRYLQIKRNKTYNKLLECILSTLNKLTHSLSNCKSCK